MSAAATARLTRRLFTPEEYLAIDRASEFRSEYHAGEIFAMSGGTYLHSLIAARLIRALGPRVQERRCEPNDSNMRVAIGPQGSYFYPDVTVVCGKPKLLSDDVLLNPVLVAEVLSKSTAKFDREIKLKAYQSIASMREVLLISQDRQQIEVHSRLGKKWTAHTYTKAEGEIRLPYFNCTIPLAEIYGGLT
ncbi:MAG: Uma2 family endonuclease [Bryobacteraceae bacterium]